MKTNHQEHKVKILYFIGSLDIGGKERRLIELMYFLRKLGGYKLKVVVTRKEVTLPKFSELEIELIVLKENSIVKKLGYFKHLHQIVKTFKPDFIHTWGRIQTLYALPTSILTKTPLINGQITDAPPRISAANKIIDKLNFRYSKVILSNSYAGIDALRPPQKKAHVIYNGLDLNRFISLPSESDVRQKYQIHTKYLVVMIANFSPRKDYETFFRVGKLVTNGRTDITWMGVGYIEEESELVKNCLDIVGDNPFLKLHSQISEVEALINASDLGVLFSNTSIHGEGISNAIIEYMALEKPVVANDAGGTREVVIHNKNGYLIQNHTDEEISKLVTYLMDNQELRNRFGKEGRTRIESEFSLNAMGEAFVSLYNQTLRN